MTGAAKERAPRRKGAKGMTAYPMGSVAPKGPLGPNVGLRCANPTYAG